MLNPLTPLRWLGQAAVKYFLHSLRQTPLEYAGAARGLVLPQTEDFPIEQRRAHEDQPVYDASLHRAIDAWEAGDWGEIHELPKE